MIDVKQAVSLATDFVLSLYGDTGSEFLLEEVEPSDDGRHWFVTIGFSVPVPPGPLDALRALQGTAKATRRVYKRLKVHGDTGEVLSMTIREV